MDDINRADATVDLEKLNWFNRQYISRFADDPDKIESMTKILRSHLNDGVDWSEGYLAECIRLLSVP